MNTLHDTRTRKSKSPLLALASRAFGARQQTAESRSPPYSRAQSRFTSLFEPLDYRFASIQPNRSSEASLKAEVDRLEASLQESLANQRSLERDYRERLAHTASIEVTLRQEIETLQASLTRCLSNGVTLNREFKARRSQAVYTEFSLRQEIDKLKKSLVQGAELKKKIETLQASLTRSTSNEVSFKREITALRSQAASTELSLRQEIDELKESLVRGSPIVSKLKEDNEVLKTTFTHVLTSERAMRTSARETREEWEKVEKSLRAEICTLKFALDTGGGPQSLGTRSMSSFYQPLPPVQRTPRFGLETEGGLQYPGTRSMTPFDQPFPSVPRTPRFSLETESDLQYPHIRSMSSLVQHFPRVQRTPKFGLEGKVASRVPQTLEEMVRSDEDTIALKQPHKPLEGSSDIHILIDGLALQSLAVGGPNPAPHWTSDAFRNRLLPEVTALERATQGLQQAVNSEIRTAYTGKCRSSHGIIPQRSANVARNLRLLVVLWEASRVEELLGSLTSILSDTTPKIGGEDCAICTDPLLPEERIVVEGCGHAMCKGCLREYIGARLGEKVWPVRCPICMAEGGRERKVQSKTVLTLAPVIAGCG